MKQLTTSSAGLSIDTAESGPNYFLSLRQKPDSIGYNLDMAVGFAILLPAVLLKPAFHNNAASFGQIFGAVLRDDSPYLNVKIGNLVYFLVVLSCKHDCWQ
jgi:hypothetical protein